MTKMYSKTFDDEMKCGGCNYPTYTFYSLEGPIEINDEDSNDPRPTGLCALCMCDMIVKEGFIVISKSELENFSDEFAKKLIK